MNDHEAASRPATLEAIDRERLVMARVFRAMDSSSQYLLSRIFALIASGLCLGSMAADVSAQTTRHYQMSSIPTAEGSDIVDVPIYHHDHGQPDGRSIVWLDPKDTVIDETNVDWTRIVAVYIDEPYNDEIADNDTDDPPCNWWSSSAQAKWDKLSGWAAEVRQKAPAARFWVNFRRLDILMINKGCPSHGNGAYIDVISMDIYHKAFSPEIEELYQALYNHRATLHQQFALVPGTFTGGRAPVTNDTQSGPQGAARLDGYFAYANSMNQQCELPLGPIGRTGIYDGCLVWMVAGWLGGAQPHRDCWNGGCDPWHYPLDHPNAIDVRNKWQAVFARRRVDPARVRQAIKAAPWLLDEK